MCYIKFHFTLTALLSMLPRVKLGYRNATDFKSILSVRSQYIYLAMYVAA